MSGKAMTRRSWARLLPLIVLGVVALPLAAPPARAAVPADARPDDGVVVKRRNGMRAVVKPKAGERLDAAVARLGREADVQWAEPNVRYKAAATPNDTCLTGCGAFQWGPQSVSAFSAWDVTHGSPAVKVAVIDGGIDLGHQDLAGKAFFGGDYTGEPTDVCEEHGTHVAGIVGAATDNGTGVAGLGWNTAVVSYRVLSLTQFPKPDCTATLFNIAQAIDDAVRDGAKVINMSITSPFDSRSIREAVTRAMAAGVVVVASAGNEGQEGNPVMYPAALPDVISVAASTPDEQTWEKSQRGQWIDVAAPGYEIVSTVPGGYGTASGTSMAAPHVAAAAALLKAHFPGISPADVSARIQRYSDLYGGSGTDVRYGRLNIHQALVGTGPGSFGDQGYWMVATDGGIFSFGVPFYGSTGSLVLNQPVFAMAATPTRKGYWFVARDGGIFNYGDAGFFGSQGGKKLQYGPVVGMAATPSGKGYWLATSGGEVYYFGDAKPFGSVAPSKPSAPIVGIAATATGNGYWLVGSNGEVYPFGDAGEHGSMAGIPLNKPVVGMAPTITGKGYWLVATDGGIFSFGDAQFRGSTGAIPLNKPIVGMKRARDGDGYWLVASDGGLFAFNAPFSGSMGGKPLNQPVVGIG